MKIATTKTETIHGTNSLKVPAGTPVGVEPAANLPADSPIKWWARPIPGVKWPEGMEEMANGVGIGLHDSDIVDISETAGVARDARYIYEGGGCNPSGLTRALDRAIATCKPLAVLADRRKDPAYAPVRMILSQLSWLFGQGIGSYDMADTDRALCRALTGPIPSLGD